MTNMKQTVINQNLHTSSVCWKQKCWHQDNTCHNPQVPHFYHIMNHVRVGTYMSILYSSIMFMALVFAVGVADSDFPAYQTTITNAMWIGQLPVFGLGMVLSYYRQRYFHITVVNRFRWAMEMYSLDWAPWFGCWVLENMQSDGSDCS